MNAWAWRIAGAVAACVAFYFVPLVRVVPIGEGAPDEADKFNAAEFAESFWGNQLLSAIGSAENAEAVLSELAKDPKAAGEAHGRRVGVSRGYFLFLKGDGILGAAAPKGVVVKLENGAELLLSTGPIFGSAVRDAAGLLDSSIAPTSREYNAIANELNRIAEDEVVPVLEGLPEGTRVRFAACAKVNDPSRFTPPLKATPILVEAL